MREMHVDSDIMSTIYVFTLFWMRIERLQETGDCFSFSSSIEHY